MRDDMVVLAFRWYTVLHVFHARKHIITHVEAELSELALLDERAMLALPLACGGPDALAAGHLLRGEIGLAEVRGGAGGSGGRGWGWLLDGLWHGHGGEAGCTVTFALAALSLSSFLSFLALRGGLVFA